MPPACFEGEDVQSMGNSNDLALGFHPPLPVTHVSGPAL